MLFVIQFVQFYKDVGRHIIPQNVSRIGLSLQLPVDLVFLISLQPLHPILLYLGHIVLIQNVLELLVPL